VFWTRYKELPEWDKMIKNIERGEEITRQKQLSIEILETKCKNKKYYDEIEFNQGIYCKFKSRFYSIEHDKYLIFANYKWGFANWREVRMGIKKEDSFEFDHYFKSRTESELNKRMGSLLKVIKAELDQERKHDEYRRKETEDLGGGKQKSNGGSKEKKMEEIIPESIEESLDERDNSQEPSKNKSPFGSNEIEEKPVVKGSKKPSEKVLEKRKPEKASSEKTKPVPTSGEKKKPANMPAFFGKQQ
jgi:hypothetical protein